jgi:hypothetical protein
MRADFKLHEDPAIALTKARLRTPRTDFLKWERSIAGDVDFTGIVQSERGRNRSLNSKQQFRASLPARITAVWFLVRCALR